MVPARHLNCAARVYVWSVIALGLGAAFEAAWHLTREPVSPQWLILAVLTVLSSSIGVKVSVIPATLSVSETFLFAAVFLFGPAPGILTALLDGFVTSLWLQRRKRNPVRLLFNMAAPALAMAPGAHLYARIGPIAGPDHIAGMLPAVALFATLYFVLNTWLVTLAIASENDVRPYDIWREHFMGVAINYFGGASVAVLMVGLGPQLSLQAVLAIVPLVGISYATMKATQKRVEDTHGHLAELRELHRSTIETLAMAVDAKDQITHGHIRRVQADAVALGRALGIDSVVLQAIEAAALLHDMGKLSVPEYILNKPGKLTAAEFDIMKRHASHGADMLSAIKFPYPVVPIVRHHHEQWNGQGYPSGLKGADIPIGARILSVVDCFDALTSDRPYRPRLSDAEALAILKERRGSFYDPQVVDTFFEIYPTIVASRTDAGAGAVAEPPRELAVETAAPGAASMQWRGAAPHFSAADLLRDVDATSDFRGAVDVVVDHLTRLVPAALTIVYVPESTSDGLRAFHAFGQSASLVTNLRMRVGERISGWVAANRKPILNSDPVLDLGDLARTATPPLQQCMSMPVIHGATLLAVISFYGPRSAELTEHHCQVVEAALAGVASTISLRADRAAAGGAHEQDDVDRRRRRIDNAGRHGAVDAFGVH